MAQGRKYVVSILACCAIGARQLYQGVMMAVGDFKTLDERNQQWLHVWHASDELPVGEEPRGIEERPPELFIDRLNRLLPEDDNTRRLSLEDIARIDEELTTFDIPRKVTVQFLDAEYISIQAYRWLFNDQNTGSKRCPNCYLRFDTWANNYEKNISTPMGAETWYRNSIHDDGIADAKVNHGCPSTDATYRDTPWQVAIGGCGESQAGTGMDYATSGRQHFDYHAGFEKVGDGVFQTTYAHMHFSPDNKFGFPELMNITDMARLLLRPGQIRAPEPEPAAFVHNDCGYKRGSVMNGIRDLEPHELVARYKCMKNKQKPALTRLFEEVPCEQRPNEHLIHDDCNEPTRDAGKTVLSSFHKFTFALENTFSRDYFTEKRWQVMFAGSVPIVWDNDNSLDSLPDPDSSLIVPHGESDDSELAKLITQQLAYYNENETAYQQFFAWKERGLRASFVRKLFLSSDFVVCRVCEHVAHYHSREGTVEEHRAKMHSTGDVGPPSR